MQVAGIDLLQIIEVIVAVAITYLIAKIVSRTLAKVFEKTDFPEEMEKWIVRISKYLVYIIGLLAIVSLSGFDLTSVIVGLGAFSIAISFAMSNVIQNFVAGLLVQADSTFKLGDEIKIQSFEGKVAKISIRTTIIETKDGDLVVIPNSIFISNPVIRRTHIPNNSE
jgi:small-conductance mechanosensitive channel